MSAYEQGAVAHSKGLDSTVCKYPVGSLLRDLWLDGYFENSFKSLMSS